MRDPNRIYKYTIKLAEVWNTVPDWRFSQLMSNFFAYLGRDPFYMEDEEFFDKLEEFIRGLTND